MLAFEGGGTAMSIEQVRVAAGIGKSKVGPALHVLRARSMVVDVGRKVMAVTPGGAS
jgi:hypothetical protein